LSRAADRTRSASESAFIFRITWPRCALTVISLVPNSEATCLFSRPATTQAMTSRSRRVREAYRSRSALSSAASSSATRLRSMASRIAFSSSSSAKGLIRNSTAPAFIARTVIGTSPWPVMKMIGRVLWSPAMRCWRSRPFRSGSFTSSTRQHGALTMGRERNSWAEAKVSDFHPAQRMSNSSESRTETSSSTTKTTGVEGGLDAFIASARDNPQ